MTAQNEPEVILSTELAQQMERKVVSAFRHMAASVPREARTVADCQALLGAIMLADQMGVGAERLAEVETPEGLGRQMAELGRRDWTKPEPPPVSTGSPAVWPLVFEGLEAGEYELDSAIIAEDALIEACRQRHEFGIRKHGVPLEVQNGRNPLRDCLDEALDAVSYSRQQYERFKLAEDWELHVEAVRLAVRVVARLLKKERTHD